MEGGGLDCLSGVLSATEGNTVGAYLGTTRYINSTNQKPQSEFFFLIFAATVSTVVSQ